MGWQNKWKHPGVRGRKPQFVAAKCTGIKVHFVPLLNKETGDIILSLLQHFHFLLLAKRIKLSTAVIVPPSTHTPGRINHDLQNLLLLAGEQHSRVQPSPTGLWVTTDSVLPVPALHLPSCCLHTWTSKVSFFHLALSWSERHWCLSFNSAEMERRATILREQPQTLWLQ